MTSNDLYMTCYPFEISYICLYIVILSFRVNNVYLHLCAHTSARTLKTKREKLVKSGLLEMCTHTFFYSESYALGYVILMLPLMTHNAQV